MQIVNVEQRSPEWYAARLGVPTSSNFDKIITTKGVQSKQRQKYLYKLAGEKVSGLPEDNYQNGHMQRGVELEDEARKLYQVITEETVIEVGFCVSDTEYKYGTSPDGLVGDEGLIEIKCPSIAVHVEYLLKKCLPSEYFQQVQGQLLVTGRKWCDFISYYPGLQPLIVKVLPDSQFIKLLKIELELFCEELEKIIAKIR